MPTINPDKGFVQLPAKQYQVDTKLPIPTDWLTKLGSLIADDILHLEDTQKLYPHDEDPVKKEFTQKTEFFYHLNRHAGPASTYMIKEFCFLRKFFFNRILIMWIKFLGIL